MPLNNRLVFFNYMIIISQPLTCISHFSESLCLPPAGWETWPPQRFRAAVVGATILCPSRLAGSQGGRRCCWWFRNPANRLRLVVYPMIFRVLYISVVQDFSHQQYTTIHRINVWYVCLHLHHFTIKHQPKVGKYIMHWSFGVVRSHFFTMNNMNSVIF